MKAFKSSPKAPLPFKAACILLCCLFLFPGSPLLAQNQAPDNPVSVDYHILTAIDHYKAGNFRMGLVTVKGGELTYPNNAQLKLLGGILEMKLEHFDQAHAYFCQAIDNGMARGAVFFKRGLCNIRNQQWQWAVEDFTQAIDRPGTVDELMQLDQSLSEPSHQSYYRRMPYIKRAQALAIMGNMEAAISDINHAASVSKNLGSEYYFIRGLIQYMSDQYEDALQSLTQAEKMGLNLGDEFYRTYGVVALHLGKNKLAITNLSKSLELNKNQSLTLRDLAIAYSLNDQNSKALKLLGENLINEQDQGMVYYDLGYFHHLNGSPKLARKFFLKAVDTQDDVLDMVELYFKLTVAPQSKLHDFHLKGLKIARSYINHGGPPKETAEKDPNTPHISIKSVSFSPDPVPVSEPFELACNFKATVPFTQTAILSFHFTISRNGKTLFESKAIKVKAECGKLTNWTQHMKPVPKPGEFQVTVFLDYIDVSEQHTTVLRIE